MSAAQTSLNRYIEQSITRAEAFLTNCQQDDGGFPATRWNSNSTSVPEDRLFITACILLAIGELLPSTCCHAALALLQSRRDTNGFWRFDAAGYLPPDADDTACALAALMRFTPALELAASPDIEPLAAFVSPNGRIVTWLDTGSLADPNTDDAVVAANVIYAMALHNRTRAQHWLTQWFYWCTSEKDGYVGSDRTQFATLRISPGETQPATPYYIHVETAGYAWTRTLRTLNLPRPTLTITDAVLNSPLRCALALSTADSPCDDLTSSLLSSQEVSGCWGAEAWFRSPGASFGSAALTTALAIEALNRQRNIRNL